MRRGRARGRAQQRTLGVRAALPAGLALAALIGLASPVAAHALLVSSDPAAGSNLASAPTEVTITFTEAPDPRLSSIKVLDAGGQSMTAGVARAVAGAPTELRVALAPLKSGVYTVAWRTISSVDGHLASGSYAFGVGVAPTATVAASGAGGAGTSSLSPVAIAGRWLLYAGLMVMLGVAFVATVIFPTPPPPTMRLAFPAWLSTVVGLALVVGGQMVDAGIGPSGLVGTSLGVGLVVRGVPILAAGSVLAWVALRSGEHAPSRVGLVVMGSAVAIAMLADAATSHAAASGAVAFNVVVQWVHVAAAGTWLGGLVLLVISLRGQPGGETRRIARRFATSATFGISAVALTGLVRALSEMGPLGNLATTDFGRVVVAKSGLLAVLAGLGAINHFRSVPAAGRVLRPLRRIGSMELMVGTTVLVLSAALVNLAPPGQVSAVAQPNEIVASGHDFGTTLRLRLVATPGKSGFNTFRVTLTDYDTGAPLDGRTVTLRFTFPSLPSVGASRLNLAPKGNGTYEARSGNLSLDGTWRITALVATQGGSAEVPLQLTTRQAPPVIDVNAAPGQPTIYTVHLRDSLTVQVYLDPGTPGANEVHVTFFDAKGTELPVPSAQLSIGLAEENPTQPVIRTLEPGHFVADVTLKAGRYTITLYATPPSGAALSTQLQIPVAS